MFEESESQTAAESLIIVAEELENDKMHFRQGMIRAAAVEEAMPGDELDHLLDAHRWLRRMTYHAGRIGHYACLLRE